MLNIKIIYTIIHYDLKITFFTGKSLNLPCSIIPPGMTLDYSGIQKCSLENTQNIKNDGNISEIQVVKSNLTKN